MHHGSIPPSANHAFSRAIPIEDHSRPATPALKRDLSAMEVDSEPNSQPGERQALQKKYRPESGSRRMSLNAEMANVSLGSNQHRNETIVDPHEIKNALASAKAHIARKKATFEKHGNHHVRSAAGMLNRTLCLASPFNKGDSTLSSFADQQNDAGHYIRSFQHDQFASKIAKQKSVKLMVVKSDTPVLGKNGKEIKILAANVGKLPNLQTFSLLELKSELENLQKKSAKPASKNLPDYVLTSEAPGSFVWDTEVCA
ncbi:hypothetical protein AAKU55_005087 [Oxalobacteraceae bacterium GrIS 1.11]